MSELSILPAPRGIHSCNTGPAPATICGNSHVCWDLDPNCRDKMAQGTNPFPKMIRALALIPSSGSSMRAHEQCTGHAEQQKCNCHQKSHFCAQRWQKLFLLQVRLIPGCRNTYFLSPPSEATEVLWVHLVGENFTPQPRVMFPQEAKKGAADKHLWMSPLEEQAPISLWYHLAAWIAQLRL